MRGPRTVYLSKLKGSSIQRLFGYLNLERSDLFLVYTYVIIGSVVSLSIPLFIQMIYGLVIGGRVSTSWIVLILLLMVGFLVSGGLQIMQYSIMERIQQRLFAKSALELSERIPNWRAEKMLKRYAPEMVNKFFDIPNIQKGLLKFISSFSTAIVQIILSLILLALYHPSFVLYGIFMIVLIILVFYFTAPKGLETSIQESNQKYRTIHWLEELSRSLVIFKMAGYTEMPMIETDKVLMDYTKSRKTHFSILKTQYIYIILFKTLFIVGLLVIGGLLVFSNAINLGQFIASEIVIIIIMSAVDKGMGNLEGLYDLLTAFDKAGKLFDQEVEVGEGLFFEQIDTGKGVELEFCDISYQYPTSKQKALRNVNFKARSGEKVCIMGFGASGKSTIINIASTLLTDFEGTMKVNGTTLSNINLLSLRSFVGENLSNDQIMNGTISENIGMGREDITFADIKQAIEDVGLGEFVQGLKDGYETKLIQNDLTIPDSVVRKLNIARSIAENPVFFLMDEPLVGLERKDKELVARFLTKSEAEWTLIVSSNDASLAKLCDRVLVMKDGEVIDEGTFDELKDRDYMTNILNS